MASDARELGLRLLDRAGIPVNGAEPYSPQIHDDRFWNRVIAERELGLGESYIDGWWDCDELDEFLTRILLANIQDEHKVTPRMLVDVGRSMAINRQSKRRAARNAQAHYDIGNDLYERMLDKRMIYSCAYWRNARDLDTAQERKLDLICRKLHLEPGMRVLDIGCGWGGFAQYAAEVWDVKVVGITPAVEQIKLARERCHGLAVDIFERDYRTMSGTYDRIISVGMMEHVGPRNLDDFFAACDRMLAPDGLMLHHTIGALLSRRHLDAWFDKYIFPGGVLPSLTQISHSVEGTFVVEDVHNIGPHYEPTLLAWRDNIEAAWAQIPHYDQRFRRMWRYYLLASAAGFRSRKLQTWQIVFRRPGRAAPYETAR